MNTMFSSPAIHVFSQENAETVPKKPGATNTLSRKPFIDRAVNGSSPRNGKLEPCMKKSEMKVPRAKTEDDDLFFYDTYSFKDIEDKYSDIKNLSQKDTLNILQKYCNYHFEPPSPPQYTPDLELFIKMPERNMFFSEDTSDNLFEISVDNISLPEVDFD